MIGSHFSPAFFNAQRSCGCCRPPPPPPPAQPYYYSRPGVPCDRCPEGSIARQWLVEIPGQYFNDVNPQPDLPNVGPCPYPPVTKCKNHTGTFVLASVNPFPGSPPVYDPCEIYSGTYVAQGAYGGRPIGPFNLIYQWDNGCDACAETGSWYWYLSVWTKTFYPSGYLRPERSDYAMTCNLVVGGVAAAIWWNDIDVTCTGPNNLVLLDSAFENWTQMPLCCDDLPEQITVRPF